MTNHRGPLTDLIPTLAIHCRHGGSDQTMHRLRAGGLEVDGATTLSELAAQCNRTHDRARAEYRAKTGDPRNVPTDDAHFGFAGRGYDDPSVGVLAFHLAQLAITGPGRSPNPEAGS